MSGLFFDTLNCEKQNINPLQPTKHKIQPFQNEGILELGIDEAGRGCLFGRLYVAGVILPNNIESFYEPSFILLFIKDGLTHIDLKDYRILYVVNIEIEGIIQLNKIKYSPDKDEE